jgi:hypothetical protein
MIPSSIVNNEDIIRVLKSLRPDQKDLLLKTLLEISDANIGKLLYANDYQYIRYLQGYISALIELVTILRKEE